MRLQGVPPNGVPSVSYVGKPEGSIVGSASRPFGYVVAIPGQVGPPGPTQWSLITDKPAALTATPGSANGVATLDSGGKVPVSQLPSSLMEYMGTWNASTNTPTLADGNAYLAGNVYRVAVAGTRNLGSGSITFDVGDYAVCNASGVWEKSDTTDSVASVNGYTGTVSLAKADVGLANVDNTSDATKNAATATLSNKTLSAPVLTGQVTHNQSWNSLDMVNTQTAQYSAASFKAYSTASTLGTSPAGVAVNAGISDAGATTAFFEISKINRSGAFVAALVSWDLASNAMNLNGQINMQSNKVVNLTNPTAAQDAATKTYVDTAAAAKADKTTTVSAGTGLTGGGDLSANRTLTVSYGTTAGTACQGNDARLSDARTPVAHNHTASQVTDFNTAADARVTAGITGKENTIAAGTTAQYWRGDKTWQTLNSTAVGLGNVDNTSDATKWSATKTLTNTRVTERVGTTASSATPSIDCGTTDQYNITALAVAVTSVTITGTPTDGQRLLVRIKDNGTARALAWGASFVSSGSGTLPTTTVANKTHLVGFIYDSAAAKWVCVAADAAGY